MDLAVHGRVLWRFRHVAAAGTLLAVILAGLSYYSVGFSGVMPVLTPAKQEVWQGESRLFLTQPGFPAGRTEQPVTVQTVGGVKTAVPKYSDPGRFTGLAPLYASLANSDEVKNLMIRTGGPLDGKVKAIPAADTTYGSVSGLPMIAIFGTAATPEKALSLARRATDTFVTYMRDRQAQAKIPADKRILIQVLNAPTEATLIVPRKKTLPIVVLVTVLFATVALVFMLDNALSRRPEEDAEPEAAPVRDVRRLA